jgi:hypothetical protein
VFKRLLTIALLLMGGLVLQPNRIVAQSYRTRLFPPIHRIHKIMNKQHKNQNYEGLKRSLLFVKQLMQQVDKRLHTRLESQLQKAIEKRNTAAIKKLLLRFVLCDILDILHNIKNETKSAKQKALFRIAFSNYKLFFSRYFKGQHSHPTHQRIMVAFRMLYRAIFATNPYGGTRQVNQRQVFASLAPLYNHLATISRKLK